MPDNKPTLADVAKKAGVSMMTVSRALNQAEKVNPQTRDRIIKIAEELGYFPNFLARGLVTNRSTTIGLVVPDISNPFFSEIAKGVEDEAHQLGYNVFLCNFDEDPQREQAALRSLAEKQVDGLILCSSRQEQNHLAQSLTPFQQVILINCVLPAPPANIKSLTLDDFNGARLAVTHFINQGRKKIVYLSGPKTSRSAGQKEAGYRQALSENYLTGQADLIRHCQPTMACGKENMLDLLKHNPEIDAVLAFNDLVAIGAILACQQLGTRIPQDLQIIGFDDIPLSGLIQPGLTTLVYPKKEIGKQSMHLLVNLFNQNQQDIPTNAIYSPQLVFRQSSPKTLPNPQT